MNLDDATRMARAHEDAYNHDFEHYADLWTEDSTAYRPGQGVTHDRATMYVLEQRAPAACPDRKTKVLRVMADEGDWMGMEELWEGTNTGGDEMNIHRLKDGKIAEMWQLIDLAGLAHQVGARTGGTPHD